LDPDHHPAPDLLRRMGQHERLRLLRKQQQRLLLNLFLDA
jgi:hypothetical protein